MITVHEFQVRGGLLQAILYIAHGSRVKRARDEAIQFITKIIRHIDIPVQHYSFLELSEPSIAQGIENCVKQGATHISLVPVLLFAAHHVKVDIPDTIKSLATQRYPHITFRYGQPLGVHDALIEIIMDRIVQSGATHMRNIGVLLVGRGSSDPEAIRDFLNVSAQLQQRLIASDVQPCFLAVAKPTLSEGLMLIKKRQHAQVFVVPYLLFSGYLTNVIEQTVNTFNHVHDQSFHICDPLGYDARLIDVLRDRYHEIMDKGETNECTVPDDDRSEA